MKLNPLGKIYYFNFNEYSCYTCKTGVCPLDNLMLDEIKKLQAIDKFCIEKIQKNTVPIWLEKCWGMITHRECYYIAILNMVIIL